MPLTRKQLKEESQNVYECLKAEEIHTQGDSSKTAMSSKTLDEVHALVKAMNTQLIELRNSCATKTDLNSIDERLNEVSNDIQKAIKDSEKALELANEAKETCKSNTDKITGLETQLTTLKTENQAISLKNSLLNEKLNKLECYNRRENLLFEGIKQMPNENCEKVLREFLSEKLGMTAVDDITFQRVHRLPTKKEINPIICRFAAFSDRQNVWSAKKKLKGTGFYIAEDFPAEYLQRRRILYPVMKKAREMQKIAYLRNDQLVIDDATYSVNCLDKLPNELHPSNLSIRKFDNVTAFFTSSCPLSNFYQAQITMDGRTYRSTEHYLQWHKAHIGKNAAIMDKIIKSETPLQAKYLGNEVKLSNDIWIPEARQAIFRACKEKFMQNNRARQFLKDTGDTILVEASTDKIWGIGVSLNDKNLPDQAKWAGDNLLGKVLMEIRNELFPK